MFFVQMGWSKAYLDLVLVPLALIFPLIYNGWLWHTVRTRPFRTTIGINSAARRQWVYAMMKDNDKKGVLVVQTIRNTIMGATLMATTSILLSTALAAILSSTYSVKRPLNDSVFGAHGDFMVALKYVTLLVMFLFAFVFYSLSICFVNQVNFLINIPSRESEGDALASVVTPEYICDIFMKGTFLNIVGNRLFYAALPLLLWIFGPVMVFLSSLTFIPIMYNLDIVFVGGEGKKGNVEGSLRASVKVVREAIEV